VVVSVDPLLKLGLQAANTRAMATAPKKIPTFLYRIVRASLSRPLRGRS
jgi:hypothetical protein